MSKFLSLVQAASAAAREEGCWQLQLGVRVRLMPSTRGTAEKQVPVHQCRPWFMLPCGILAPDRGIPI